MRLVLVVHLVALGRLRYLFFGLLELGFASGYLLRVPKLRERVLGASAGEAHPPSSTRNQPGAILTPSVRAKQVRAKPLGGPHIKEPSPNLRGDVSITLSSADR